MSPLLSAAAPVQYRLAAYSRRNINKYKYTGGVYINTQEECIYICVIGRSSEHNIFTAGEFQITVQAEEDESVLK